MLIIANANSPAISQGKPVYPNDNTLVMGTMPNNGQVYYGQPNNLNQPLNGNQNQIYVNN